MIRYEAENAVISQGVVESNHAGFSGTGFVNYDNLTGSFVQWTVTAAQAGSATLTFRFANGTTANRPMDIIVNGTLAVDEMAFAPTGAWTTWQSRTATVPLNAGSNTMTAEAVKGGESTKPRPGRVPFPIEHYLTLPFTRNLAGSMDFTPVTFSGVRLNIDAAELALSVVFESGVQHFADSIDVYAAYPVASRFLREVPAAWDETTVLAGDPMSQAVLARRHGPDWFIGAITGGAARTVTAPLPPGDWLADTYFDGPDGRIALRTGRVTGSMSVAVAANGGFAVHLCPAVPGATTCATRFEAEQATISQGVVESNHAGFSGTGFVNYDNLSGSFIQHVVPAAAATSVTLTLRYANGTTANRPMDIVVNGAVVASSVAFGPTGAWTNWHTRTITIPLTAGTNTIRAVATTSNGGPNLDFLDINRLAQ